MRADFKCIRDNWPSSREELESLIQQDVSAAYEEFKLDFDIFNRNGTRTIYYTLTLWHWATKLQMVASEEDKSLAAYQICKWLQYPIYPSIYPRLDVIKPMLDNPELLIPLTVVTIMHMIIPQLNDKIPPRDEPFELESKPSFAGPVTLYQQFQAIKVVDVDLKEFFGQLVKPNFPSEENVSNLVDIFVNFRKLAGNITRDSVQAISDVYDMYHLIDNSSLCGELSALTMLPASSTLLRLADSMNTALSRNARNLFTTTVSHAFPVVQLIGDRTSIDIVAKTFTLPGEVLARKTARIHYDILFEALDNSDRCFESGSFVRLVYQSVSRLEQSVVAHGGIDDFNRVILNLSPPLSSMAIICHLIFEVYKRLDNVAPLTVLQELFARRLPPLPLRHFDTAMSPQLARATEGIDFRAVDKKLLHGILQSLVNVLTYDIEYFGEAIPDDFLEEFTFQAHEMVVCSLVCAFDYVQHYSVIEALARLVRVHRNGMMAFLSTIVQLSSHSIKFAGLGMEILSDLISTKAIPQLYLKDSLLRCESLLVGLINKWHRTNAPSLQILLTQLEHLHLGHLVRQFSVPSRAASNPADSSSGANGTGPAKSAMPGPFAPIILDLAKLDTSVC